MTGLEFPSHAPLDRETSYEYGTSLNNADDIHIDPALGGPVIDPALIGEGDNATSNDVQPEIQHPQQHVPPPVHYGQIQEYSAGPQGDPFAPQQLPVYFPIEVEPPAPPPKPVKRKRRPTRERECGTCEGNDRKNSSGQPEVMLICDECRHSVHPSCLDLDGPAETLRSYSWKCNDCKSCEICQEQGKEDRMIFCDFCDRGWHMDCMNPALQEVPNKWHCPKCPPVELVEEPINFKPEMFLVALADATSAARGPSVASSSRSALLPTRSQTRLKGKRKAKAIPIDESDSGDVDVEETPTVTRERGRPKSTRKAKPNPLRALQSSEDDRDVPTRSPRQAKRTRMQHSPIAQPMPKIRLRLPGRKGKGREHEEDESLKGLFDDILGVDQRDTTQTSITHTDEQRYERSRRIAEEKMLPPPTFIPLPDAADISCSAGPSRPTRSALAHHLSALATPSTPLGLSSASPAPSNSTPVPVPFSKADGPNLRIRTIRFGQYDIQTWYDAPFPEEYANIPDGRLWICEFCLKYMKSRFAIERHWLKCKARHPPGDEIYRDGDVSIFEVDGRKNKIYCQNLCLLSKMFLDHKSLFYDVEPFLFYVMTEVDDFGARFVGYFSKEKWSPKDYNVSCIMTLPVRQRQGWGNLLIDFSYLLSKKEQRAGSPEKPLSGLGALGYKNYWTLSLMRYLQTAPGRPQLEDISRVTSMTIEDVFVTLTQQGMISAGEAAPLPPRPVPGQSIKFPKGRKNGVARKQIQRTHSNGTNKHKNKEMETPKGPFVPPPEYEITWDRDRVNEWLARWEAKGYLKLRAERLRWSPYVLTRREREQEQAKEGEQAPEGGTSAKPIEILDDEELKEASAPPPPPLNIFDDELVDHAPDKEERSEPRSPEIGEARMESPRKNRTGSRLSPASRVPTARQNGSDQPRVTRAVVGLPTTMPPRPESVLEEEGRKQELRQVMASSPPTLLPKAVVAVKRRRTGSVSGEETAASNGCSPSGKGMVRGEDVGAMLFDEAVMSIVKERQDGVIEVEPKREDLTMEEVYDADAEGELEEEEEGEILLG